MHGNDGASVKAVGEGLGTGVTGPGVGSAVAIKDGSGVGAGDMGAGVTIEGAGVGSGVMRDGGGLGTGVTGLRVGNGVLINEGSGVIGDGVGFVLGFGDGFVVGCGVGLDVIGRRVGLPVGLGDCSGIDPTCIIRVQKSTSSVMSSPELASAFDFSSRFKASLPLIEWCDLALILLTHPSIMQADLNDTMFSRLLCPL